MTKNSKTVATIAIAATLLAIVLFLGRDFLLGRGHVAPCADGPHPTIDMREFTTEYWAYSAKLDANVAGKAKLSTELDPKVLSQVSQGLQEAREFRKYVVAGYNACAITQAQYAQFGSRFNALDSLAQEINALLLKPALSQEEKTRVAMLVAQYGDLASKLGSQ
jgi:hypothetical protein